jgi:hypothetical protein
MRLSLLIAIIYLQKEESEKALGFPSRLRMDELEEWAVRSANFDNNN